MLLLRKFSFELAKQLITKRHFVNVINEAGNVTSNYKIPDHIIKPHYFYELNKPASFEGEHIEIKNEEEIAKMRTSCKIAAKILNKCQDIVKVQF